MLSWATKRQLQYFSIIVVVIILFVVIPFYKFIYKAPTCFDGVRNGGETGVDCGGSCRLLCTAQIEKPISRWDPRIFKVSEGVYSVLAYLENPNVTGEVLTAPYIFKLYDKSNVLIAEVKGRTYIPKGRTFAVFEGGIESVERIPHRATFDFEDRLLWTRDTSPDPDILVTNKALSKEDISPRVDATVSNRSLEEITNIELTGIIFDGSGNAIGASRTFVESLDKGESKDIVFTWPEPFETGGEICASPVDVVLIIDRSGSMDDISLNPPQPLTDVKEAAISFINELREGDQAAVISFSDTASIPIDQTLSADFLEVKKSIEKIFIGTSGIQNTNIADGILQAEEELKSQRHNNNARKIAVLLTDGVATRPEQSGNPRHPEEFALQSANFAKTAGVGVFSIGLGKDINADFLKRIASSSDDFFQAPSAKDLTAIYDQIATKICQKRPAIIEILFRLYPEHLLNTSNG